LKTAVIYTRVSTDEQLQHGSSLESQSAACRRYAEGIGAAVVAEFREQMSGARWDRPLLAEARDMLRAGQANILIAYSPDRLARDVALLSLLFAELAKQKAELHTVMMPIDASPMGKAALQMAGVFAEMERAQIAERSKRGKDTLARQGRIFTGNYVPYGYTYDKGKLFINEAEAIWVRQMFGWSAKGMSCYGIAQELTRRGVPTKRGGDCWRKTSVKDMLRSATFKGEWHYGKKISVEPKKPRKSVRRKPNSSWAARDASEVISVPCPAIVSAELWGKVQAHLEESKRKTRRAVFPYLLSGRIRCGYCGRAYAGSGGAQHPYYNCPGKQRDVYGSGQPCANESRNARLLDAEVWSRIEQMMSQPDTILALFARSEDVEAELDRMTADLAHCEGRLSDLIRRKNNLLDLAESGDIDKQTYRERRARLDKEQVGVAQLQDQLSTSIANIKNSTMTREDAEQLARYWRACARSEAGHPFLADAETGENIFLKSEFRRWAVEKMNLQVTVEGTRTLLRGTFTSGLLQQLQEYLEWNEEIAEVKPTKRTEERTGSGTETDNSLYCTTYGGP
jgi:site-specific DNA recombinase